MVTIKKEKLDKYKNLPDLRKAYESREQRVMKEVIPTPGIPYTSMPYRGHHEMLKKLVDKQNFYEKTLLEARMVRAGEIKKHISGEQFVNEFID